MEEIIEKYIDTCIDLVRRHKEYLMYVSFWEGNVEREMLVDFDISAISDKPQRIKIVQPERTSHIVDIISGKDKMWKEVDNDIPEDRISKLEKELNITLPKSYKVYLKYKHYYEIFWDLEIVLYPKPIHSWDTLLLERNLNTKEIILDKGYFSIGRFSDYGEIALKLNKNETEEGEVVLFDYETGNLSEILSDNFISLLNTTLQIPEPKSEELKEWEKRMNN